MPGCAVVIRTTNYLSGMLQLMRWPYNTRIEPVHAWGVLTVGTAGLVGIPTVLVALHVGDGSFRWWWPTNWMFIPAALLFTGFLLLIVPLRRADTADQGKAAPDPPTGQGIDSAVEVDQVGGDVAAVRAEVIDKGVVKARAKARRVDPGAKLTGVDVKRFL